MDRSRTLVLNVWREACRPIEIGESTVNIARLLSVHAPLAMLILRRIDLPHGALRTVAVAQLDGRAATLEQVTSCPPTELKRLLAWFARPHVLRRGRRRKLTGELALVVPEGIAGDVLAVALSGPSGAVGVLLIVAKAGAVFDDPHVELAESLREPIGVALENDRRLHEMATLREAAEAERRSLLHRLGRTERAEPIVGAEGGLRSVLERVQLVARSDVPILILGETGTGKEVIARSIHNRSPRSAAPFIRVNCGAIPPELIDSQLFGHERGSFTGAAETRAGWFERADGGTLFLDEIGELPPAAQVRLLRVLQDGHLERVGGQQSLQVDVRIVAATHRDLAAMVKTGQFREDLWYRVAVFPVPLPPLRERLEDIPGLARHFAERAATRFGLPVVMPTPDDVRLLVGYAWPGNIRELGAVIDRAALLGEGKRLELARALGVQAGGPTSTGGAALYNSPAAKNEQAGTAIVPLDEAVRGHIERALAATRGRIEGPFGAAALLRINPHTLRARMRKLRIDWRRFRAPLE